MTAFYKYIGIYFLFYKKFLERNTKENRINYNSRDTLYTNHAYLFCTAKGDEHVMTEQDTVKLLRECDAGTKMGIASMENVMDYIHDREVVVPELDGRR